MKPVKRNPARVLAAIQATLEKHPELRVGQLLCVAMRENGRDLDLFNVEDDDLAQLVGAIHDLEAGSLFGRPHGGR